MKFYAIEQPPVWEFVGTDDIFIKQMPLPEKGMVVPQHSHTYSHYTMLATGSLRVIKDGVDIGVFHAPKPIWIEAGCKHLLISESPNTLAYCIHNLHGREDVDIADEHHIDIEVRKAG